MNDTEQYINPYAEYIAIILQRQANPLPKGEYGESHHIIPKSIRPDLRKCKWNIVKLTPEEHYRCHKLLPLIYTQGTEHTAMVYAWHRTANTHKEFLSEAEYAEAKRNMAGCKIGVPRSDETRKKIGDAQRGKPRPWLRGIKRSEEEKQVNREKHLGKHHSDEARRKISEKCKAYWANRRAV